LAVPELNDIFHYGRYPKQILGNYIRKKNAREEIKGEERTDV
jgi:hypothetical protein